MAGSEGARVSLRCSPFLLLLLGVLAGGCAGPATRVVLLPQADGSPSAVVVRATGESVSHMLSAPYQRAIVERGEPVAMMPGVAEDRRQADELSEIMADDTFVGRADRAVKLHRILTDLARRPASQHAGGRDREASVRRARRKRLR